MWGTISPLFCARPDWRVAANRKSWPRGLALLFVIGLGGSIALLFVSLAAAKTGYESTLEDQLLSMPLLSQLVSVAVVAPVFEETSFRLALTARPRVGRLALPGVQGSGYAGSRIALSEHVGDSSRIAVVGSSVAQSRSGN